jgi:MIP family channel proteins
MAEQGLYGSGQASNLPRVIVAEIIGTYFLVLAGTAAAVAAVLQSPIAGSPADSLAVALSFGLVLISLVFALGHISGAHFNPAVTLGLAAVGKFPIKYVPFYLLSQIGGAFLAALTVLYAYGDRAKSLASLGATYPAQGITALKAMVVEAFITFLLMLVIMAVATDPRTAKAAAGTAVGFALAVAILIGGPLTGGAVNPARALGPMIVAGDLTAWWAYLAGPILGAVLAAVIYQGVLAQAEEPSQNES